MDTLSESADLTAQIDALAREWADFPIAQPGQLQPGDYLMEGEGRMHEVMRVAPTRVTLRQRFVFYARPGECRDYDRVWQLTFDDLSALHHRSVPAPFAVRAALLLRRKFHLYNAEAAARGDDE